MMIHNRGSIGEYNRKRKPVVEGQKGGATLGVKNNFFDKNSPQLLRKKSSKIRGEIIGNFTVNKNGGGNEAKSHSPPTKYNKLQNMMGIQQKQKVLTTNNDSRNLVSVGGDPKQHSSLVRSSAKAIFSTTTGVTRSSQQQNRQRPSSALVKHYSHQQ